MLSLVKVKMLGFEHEKTLEVLKRVVEKSVVFKLSDLEGF